jgi:predicted DsbA family dithiol-disulfide isomerase
MEPIRIAHYSDALCVWAYVSEVRCDELLAQFEGQVTFECRYFQVFGSVLEKLDRQWGDRGGASGYSEHVKGVAGRFDHVTIHPEVWVRNTPESSMPSHLFLCGVRILEEQGSVAPGSLRRTAWMLRQAFFVECADISRRSVLFEIAEQASLPIAALERLIDTGAAHAALSGDLELARDQGIRSSPTLLFNEGRQQLTGNVGYRIIEANVRELLESPASQQSWC